MVVRLLTRRQAFAAGTAGTAALFAGWGAKRAEASPIVAVARVLLPLAYAVIRRVVVAVLKAAALELVVTVVLAGAKEALKLTWELTKEVVAKLKAGARLYLVDKDKTEHEIKFAIN